jgi:SAM-dependent methyltransferase
VTLLGGIAQRIVETIHPALVLDAGCALGILVEVLRQRGVDAQGIDLSSYAIAHVHESVRPYCRVGSITDELPTRYDLIVSIEVLEHLPAAAGAAAIANFCRHTDDVLFSSTPQHYRDATRLNVQPAEYWAELFAEHGLYRDVEFDASFISPWAARYRRSRDGFPRIVRQYERGYAQLSLERNELRSFAYEVQLELARSIEQMPSLQHELTLVRLQRDAEQAANVEARIALVNAARELAAARVTLDTERQRLNSEAERELVDVRAAMDELYGQLNQRILDSETIRNDLAQARATIHNMERSFFWRVRKWLRRS